MRTLIDGHLDLAWNALGWNRDVSAELDDLNRDEAGETDHPGRGRATTSLPEMRQGNVALCQATLLSRVKPASLWDRFAQGPPRANLDWRVADVAAADAMGQLAYYRRLESRGLLRSIRNRRDLDAHWSAWDADSASSPIGYILAMEGADPIVSPALAGEWWDLGLRSANLAHYGECPYAAGTGAEGPVTPAGLELLREFERLGIILDVTHLADQAFFQALDAFAGPVLASHNNCRALVPDQRQFSDEQIQLLIGRDAVIGVALDAWMLYPGWVRRQTSREVVGLEALADHIDHVCQLSGDHRHVAIGSDLDGGFGTEQTPKGLDRISDLQKLDGILAARGFTSAAIDAVFHGNWLRFFREHLPE